jgi:hypothetical protein
MKRQGLMSAPLIARTRIAALYLHTRMGAAARTQRKFAEEHSHEKGKQRDTQRAPWRAARARVCVFGLTSD